MCNLGVNKSQSNKIVLLDSDRILPHRYFEHCFDLLDDYDFITTRCHYSLNKPYTDDDIIIDAIDKTQDFRSTTNELRRKNLFSGNTVFNKQAYLEVKGMDESFIGYGFADNDMTRKVTKIHFLEMEELHLYHPKEFLWKGKKLDKHNLQMMSMTNCMKYLQKWNLQPTPEITDILEQLNQSKETFEKEILGQFQKLYPKYSRSIRKCS
jgi:predicted glycosyltransferase involved in capsule biosynthesis